MERSFGLPLLCSTPGQAPLSAKRMLWRALIVFPFAIERRQSSVIFMMLPPKQKFESFYGKIHGPFWLRCCVRQAILLWSLRRQLFRRSDQHFGGLNVGHCRQITLEFVERFCRHSFVLIPNNCGVATEKLDDVRSRDVRTEVFLSCNSSRPWNALIEPVSQLSPPFRRTVL